MTASTITHTLLRALVFAVAGYLPIAGHAQQSDSVSDWSGFIELEYRHFDRSPLYPAQADNYASVAAQPKFSLSWNNYRTGLVFSPFIRAADRDDERNHADIRELVWYHAAADWEIRAGIEKVFWGVTESLHLVDIINQTDAVENPDGEDKLGQPLVQLSLMKEWGTTSFYVMPAFRQRTFAGLKGRLRPALLIDTDHARFESADGDDHLDLALRWSHYIDDLDLSVSHFSGTSRAPDFDTAVSTDQSIVLIPRYDLIEQTGATLQLIVEEWLWKAELVSVRKRAERYSAAVAGFEYTHVGLAGSVMDLGILAEYLFDDRHEAAPTPFEDDLMVGLRLAANDVESSELLLGVIYDLSDGSRAINIEASRRVGQSTKLSFESRAFSGLDNKDPLYIYRRDRYVQFSIAYYY